MDIFYHHAGLSAWLIHYGAFALFFLLAVGIIAFPIPNESIMIAAGILMYEGHLSIVPTIVASLAGNITGISLSYVLGRTFGKYFIRRYGAWMGITPEEVRKAHQWFRRYGKWTLFFGYFVPGIRHFTGVIAGSVALDFELFALFSYTGACVWAILFLALGYFFGDYWKRVFEWFEVDLDEVVIVCVFFALLYYTIRQARQATKSKK